MPASEADARASVRGLVASVTPFDDRETADQREIVEWIDAGAPLYRRNAPADPPQHLAVYFVVLDEDDRALLLVDHIKAGCWLPPGGHVDRGEDPRAAVVREADEELGVRARFHPTFGRGGPFFLTRTMTRGPHSHADVTLWFVLRGRRDDPIRPDPGEFRNVDWWPLDGAVRRPSQAHDPQLHRFVAKLTMALGARPRRG